MEENRISGHSLTILAFIIASEQLATLTGAHPSDIRGHLLTLAEQRYTHFRQELAANEARRYIQSNSISQYHHAA